MKFDGRGFANIIEEQVREKVTKLTTKPKIVSILVGDDPASVLYTRLKKEAAERVGINFFVKKIDSTQYTVHSLQGSIREIASGADVAGLMIQLPVPGLQGLALKEVMSAIPHDKDVDGLRYPESGVVPPVVSAVLRIMDRIAMDSGQWTVDSFWKRRIIVVGAAGFVGSGVMEQLSQRGTAVIGVERGDDMSRIKDGDVIISAVGEAGIIKSEMVIEGVVVIDVGAPAGDMERGVYQKASVSVEVPGGVGPVTIACLMEQAVKLYGRKNSNS